MVSEARFLDSGAKASGAWETPLASATKPLVSGAKLLVFGAKLLVFGAELLVSGTKLLVSGGSNRTPEPQEFGSASSPPWRFESSANWARTHPSHHKGRGGRKGQSLCRTGFAKYGSSDGMPIRFDLQYGVRGRI